MRTETSHLTTPLATPLASSLTNIVAQDLFPRPLPSLPSLTKPIFLHPRPSQKQPPTSTSAPQPTLADLSLLHASKERPLTLPEHSLATSMCTTICSYSTADEPEHPILNFFPAASLPSLVEQNPTLASHILTLDIPLPPYLLTLSKLPLSLRSMEVVSTLTARLTSSKDHELVTFLRVYITNCLASCASIQDRYLQSRAVR